ncbi:Hypothetical predicted protein, partial [Paramuricea clavata]
MKKRHSRHNKLYKLWNNWQADFEMFIIARPRVREIFKQLTDNDDNYEVAKAKLKEYFDPQKNRRYEVQKLIFWRHVSITFLTTHCWLRVFWYLTMAEQLRIEVTTLIENEIQRNNHTLLESTKSLLDSSVQQLKRLKYSEPHSFKKKANEDQHKFNTKVIDSLAEVSDVLAKRETTEAQDHLQKGEHMLNERQKHILLADKSEFGWATVHEYKKHELGEDSEDEKRILKSEIRAKAQRSHKRIPRG